MVHFLMFDTKFAIVLREDLPVWQKLNVTAFLTSSIVAQFPDIIGEPYRDRSGNSYNPLSIQPVIVLSADQATLATIHRRALERGVTTSLYVEEMFATGHDAANRAVFAEFGPDDARVVGIALRAEKKLVDKITKGARMQALDGTVRVPGHKACWPSIVMPQLALARQRATFGLPASDNSRKGGLQPSLASDPACK